jgi:aminomethyltransferase
MVLVPPAFARVLWRSFLSFTYVTPVGREALRSWALGTKLGDVVGWLEQQDRVQVPRQELISRGLVRADGGFVGERGLS